MAIHSYNTNVILGVLIQFSYLRCWYISSHYFANWLAAAVSLFGKSSVKTNSAAEETGWAAPAYPDTFCCFAYSGYTPASQEGTCRRRFVLFRVYKITPTTSTQHITIKQMAKNQQTDDYSVFGIRNDSKWQGQKNPICWFAFACFYCPVITKKNQLGKTVTDDFIYKDKLFYTPVRYIVYFAIWQGCTSQAAKLFSLPKFRGFFRVP